MGEDWHCMLNCRVGTVAQTCHYPDENGALENFKWALNCVILGRVLKD